MRRGLLVALVGLLALASHASAASNHTLKTYEARSATESAAFQFQMKRDLDSSSVGRCQRKALRRVACDATVKGETATANRTCDLLVSVRAVYRSFYWDTVASIGKRSCRDEAKPLLTYDIALAAIQAEADRFAGRRTRVTSLNRRDDVTFYGSADWERPRVPPNEYLPTETCSVSLVATLSQSIVVTNDGFSCY